MDSQENTLNQGTIEEPQVEATVAETPAVENTSEAETKTYATKQEVLDRVKEIAHSDEAPQKNELDLLKTTFYKLHLAERDAQMKKSIWLVAVTPRSMFSCPTRRRRLSRRRCRSSKRKEPRFSSHKRKRNRPICRKSSTSSKR